MASSNQELDRLDDLLADLPQDSLPMTPSELDGYLTGINEGNSRFSDQEIDEIDLQAPDLIPDCVATILLASRPELTLRSANDPDEPTRRQRPGRNEPCLLWLRPKIQAVLRKKLRAKRGDAGALVNRSFPSCFGKSAQTPLGDAPRCRVPASRCV